VLQRCNSPFMEQSPSRLTARAPQTLTRVQTDERCDRLNSVHAETSNFVVHSRARLRSRLANFVFGKSSIPLGRLSGLPLSSIDEVDKHDWEVPHLNRGNPPVSGTGSAK